MERLLLDLERLFFDFDGLLLPSDFSYEGLRSVLDLVRFFDFDLGFGTDFDLLSFFVCVGLELTFFSYLILGSVYISYSTPKGFYF